MAVYKETAPAYWAGYIVNGESEGMADAEIAACDKWLAWATDGNPRAFVTIGPEEEEYFGRWSRDWGQPGVTSGGLIDYSVVTC